MKNKIKRLVFIIGLFLMSLTNVDAKEMTSEEISNNSYVIGTHIFTEKTTLLTKHIMLSSKTIKSNSLDDMIVYYKTPRGKWINGADGSQLEVPSKFDIDYIDLELIETEFNITYILDGGTASNPLIYTASTNDFTLVNPVKEGYLFLGWTGSNDNTPELEVTIKKGTTGDLEYTANWVLCGDANADGKVNSNDSTIILDYLEGSEDEIDLIAADVNLDGEVDNIDAVIILHFSTEFIETLPYDSGEKYSINYNLDGGINDSRNPSVYAEISLSLTLEEPTKEGYIFLGWTGSNGDTPEIEVTIEEETTGDLEFIANWGLYGDLNNDNTVDVGDMILLNQYLAGYDAEISMLNADVNTDGEVDEIDLAIIRKFKAGWDITFPYDSGKKYTITYNLNDGSFEDYAFKKYAEISLPYTLETPIKEGYVFLGWTGSNGNTPQLKVTISEGTTGNLEYTANWMAKEDIPAAPIIEDETSLEQVDGTLQGVINICNDGDYSYQNKPVGAELYVKTNDGYTLVEDKTNACEFVYKLNPGEAKAYSVRTYKMYKDVLKVYSNYSNELLVKNENIITYDLNGGINAKNNPMGYASDREYNSLLEEPTKKGYTFIGWTGSNGDTPELKVSIPEETTGKLNYIANWELSDEDAIDKTIPTTPIIEVGFSIDIKDGSKDALIDVCENGDYNYQNKPFGAALYIKTKEANNLYSYTLVEEINNQCEFGVIVNPGETNVYAVMTYILDENDKRVYSNYSNELLIETKNVITYDLNGGINSKNNPFGYSSNYPYGYTLEEPTKDGYTFIGWTGSNGDTPELKVTINKDTTGHLHYVANWELNK